MIRNILSLGTLFAMSSFGASALLFVACGGQTSGSSPTGTLQPVAVSAISGAITACKSGFAHPNVCCEAGPGKESACGVYPGAPFETCGTGRTTYPDPRSCCALDGSGSCEAPPTTPINPTEPSCAYPCPPGQYNPPGEPGVCCYADSSGVICSASGGGGVVGSGGTTGSGSSGGTSTGSGSSGSGGGEVDGGTIAKDASPPGIDASPVPDAGEVDGGSYGGDASCSECVCPPCPSGEKCGCDCPPGPVCPPPPPPPVCSCPACPPGAECLCDCEPPPPPCACACPADGEPCPAGDCPPPPPPPPPVCNACPPGWQVPVGDPYLCCAELDGIIACFSQGVPPYAGTPMPISTPGSTPGGTASK